MKTFIVSCLMLVPLVCSAQAQAGDFKELTQKLKTPVVLQNGEYNRMAVTFNHSSHKDIKCGYCHHQKTEKTLQPYASCAAEGCHVQQGKSKDPKSLFMAYHSKKAQHSCYNCHHEQAATNPALKGCRPCHQAK